MSGGSRRRRRRGGRRSSALAGDPLDLFLDAITNALGVIMFILLMVVIFGRASDSPAAATASKSEAREVRELEELRKELEAKVNALPPAGDPELAARWKAAMEKLPKLEEEVAQLQSESLKAESRASAATVKLNEDQKVVEKLRLEVSQSVTTVKPSGFIRVSRFQEDKRKSVILTLANGKLSRFRATSETKEISAPTTGSPIISQASATDVTRQLLDGFQPATYRVELLVWEGSFRQAKMVEQALLEMGFDSNPLAVRAGTALKPGAGGVQ